MRLSNELSWGGALGLLLACSPGQDGPPETGTGSTTGTTVALSSSTTGVTSEGTDPPTGGPTSDATSSTTSPSSSTSDGSTETGPSETDPSEEPPVCPPSGRFNVERYTDSEIALIDDLVFSSSGMSLDLYVPDVTLEPCPNRPVLLMVHGGAWIVGQKEWMDARARFHARRGLVVATIDYRKTDQGALCMGDGWNRAAYRAMQDVHAAIQTLVADADQHAIDTAAIFLYGNSAGAMTTLSLALTDDAAVAAAFPAIVADEGPLDAQSLQPGTPYEVRAMYTQAGAVLDDALLDPMSPPPALLLMHSEGDESVPYAVGGSAVCPNNPLTVYGSSWIRDTKDAPGGCIALVEVEGATHDLDEVYGERCDAVDPPCEPSRLDETADRFFSAVLGGTCDSQHSFCTPADCQLVEGQPDEWFTLFP